jgi:hypothetical protein
MESRNWNINKEAVADDEYSNNIGEGTLRKLLWDSLDGVSRPAFCHRGAIKRKNPNENRDWEQDFNTS